MERCLICFKRCDDQRTLWNYFWDKDCICENCRRQMEVSERWICIEGLKIYTFYQYNRFLENLLFQFKEGRDIALREVFFYRYRKWVEKTFFGYTIVCLPSSKKRIEKRTFYPLHEMVKTIRLPKLELFEKTKDYKQSEQGYEQRKRVREVLALKQDCCIPDKVLLVDDVITSGETMLSAYLLIKDHTKTIKGLVVSDNYLSVELCDEKKFPFFTIVDILKRK